MKKTFLIFTGALLFSLAGFSQDTGGKQKSHTAHQRNQKYKKQYTRLPAAKKQATTDEQPPKVTNLHNSGSSNGTMASNNDPGKVTTNPNKNSSASNGAAKRGRKK